MVAKEGGQHFAAQRFLHLLHKACKLSGRLGARADGAGDVALRLRSREEEEAVQPALIILGDGGKPRPRLAHQIAARLERFGRIVQPAQEAHVLLGIGGIVAGHRIQAEAVRAAFVQPEIHDGGNLAAHRLAVQVQIRHAAAGELLLIIPVRTGHRRHLLAALLRKAVVIHIGIGHVARAERIAGLHKPRVLHRGMIDGQIHNQADAALMARLRQCAEIRQRAVLRIDLAVIGDVILVVAGAGHDGHEPQAVIAQTADIVQPAQQPGQVAHTVAVAVLIGAHKHLVPAAGRRLLLRLRAGKQADQSHQNRKHSFHD